MTPVRVPRFTCPQQKMAQETVSIASFVDVVIESP
jgi:hypothetical protein